MPIPFNIRIINNNIYDALYKINNMLSDNIDKAKRECGYCFNLVNYSYYHGDKYSCRACNDVMISFKK